MRSKELLLKTLNHEEPDRVPVDLGSTNVTTITWPAYVNLCKYLGLDKEKEITVVDRIQQIVVPDEEVLLRLKVDTRSVWLPKPGTRKVELEEEDAYMDDWGIVRKKVAGSWYYDVIKFPLEDANSIEDLLNYKWPNPNSLKKFEKVENEAKKLYSEGVYPVVIDPTGSVPFQNSQLLRGFGTFLMDLVLNKSFAEFLMDKLVEFQIKRLEKLLKEVGNYINVIKIADDLGTQKGPLISPELYRNLIKPRHRQLIQFIKKKSKAKILFHSDGGIYPFIEDLIDIGVDILNPVQVSAHGMDTKRLKREFGKSLCFWGGIDTQRTLPYGSIKDVEDEVKRRIDELAPGGGYVLAPGHNIQPDVPPENIVAMYQTAIEYGKK